MPKTNNYDRLKSSTTNTTPIIHRVLAAEGNNTPVVFDPPAQVEAAVHLPHMALLVYRNDSIVEHQTFSIGADVYEVLGDGGSLTFDSNIPIYLHAGYTPDVILELATAINGARSSFSWSFFLSDAATPGTTANCALNGTESVFATKAEGSYQGYLQIWDAVSPGGGFKYNARSLVVASTFEVCEFAINTFFPINTETIPFTPDAHPYTPGTTGAVTAKIQVDADPTGGTEWKDLWRIKATPALSAGGTATLSLETTPVNGDGSVNTTQPSLLTHPQNMDVFQTAAGFPRV